MHCYTKVPFGKKERISAQTMSNRLALSNEGAVSSDGGDSKSITAEAAAAAAAAVSATGARARPLGVPMPSMAVADTDKKDGQSQKLIIRDAMSSPVRSMLLVQLGSVAYVWCGCESGAVFVWDIAVSRSFCVFVSFSQIQINRLMPHLRSTRTIVKCICRVSH
jgi:hypothetical protein